MFTASSKLRHNEVILAPGFSWALPCFHLGIGATGTYSRAGSEFRNSFLMYSANDIRIKLVLILEPRLENSYGEGEVFEMAPLGLKRIYWPVNAARGRDAPGWVVGWLNSENDYFVIAVLPEGSVKVLSTKAALILD